MSDDMALEMLQELRRTNNLLERISLSLCWFDLLQADRQSSEIPA